MQPTDGTHDLVRIIRAMFLLHPTHGHDIEAAIGITAMLFMLDGEFMYGLFAEADIVQPTTREFVGVILATLKECAEARHASQSQDREQREVG